MRIHRDTCSSVEFHVTANTKMGIKYKIGVSKLSIDSLTYDQQIGSILLPLYKSKTSIETKTTQFMIGEMNVDISKRPFLTYTE